MLHNYLFCCLSFVFPFSACSARQTLYFLEYIWINNLYYEFSQLRFIAQLCLHCQKKKKTKATAFSYCLFFTNSLQFFATFWFRYMSFVNGKTRYYVCILHARCSSFTHAILLAALDFCFQRTHPICTGLSNKSH